MVGLTGLPQRGVGDGGRDVAPRREGWGRRPSRGPPECGPRAELRLGDPRGFRCCPQGRSAKRLALEWEPRKRVPSGAVRGTRWAGSTRQAGRGGGSSPTPSPGAPHLVTDLRMALETRPTLCAGAASQGAVGCVLGTVSLSDVIVLGHQRVHVHRPKVKPQAVRCSCDLGSKPVPHATVRNTSCVTRQPVYSRRVYGSGESARK